ncbi:MAG: TetR/AcrR family transcriptional regulator [Chloroflexi bacterium HGW-Chloroflexi-6]|nr:MAG: TetR/AcrR family transcriptional regulator [Chloroflexi bacterium HGW-Chloroflexi-6]
MSDNREKFLLTASALMEKQGYCGTGLNEILEKSGAPKGSLYYYFPDGKEQIASEVALRAGKIISGRIQERTRDQPEAGKAIHEFLYTVALRMEETEFHTGSTITMVAMESVAQSQRINQACREAYGMIIDAFKGVLLNRGMEEAKAVGIAEMIVAAVEGGIMLSRTYQSADYLRRVADHIRQMLDSKIN